jgi:hypothetical protein
MKAGMDLSRRGGSGHWTRYRRPSHLPLLDKGQKAVRLGITRPEFVSGYGRFASSDLSAQRWTQ